MRNLVAPALASLRACVALAAVAVAGCGDSAAPPTPAIIVFVGQAGLSGTVGQALLAPVLIEIRDDKGAVLKDIEFTVVVTGGGTLLPTPPTKTTSGSTSLGTWTLGTTAGIQTLQISAAGLSLSIPATATPGAPALTASGSGSTSGTGTVASISTLTPSIKVTDVFGNPISGVQVTSTITGGGSVQFPSPTTNSAGVASVGTWTLGTTAGTQTVTLRAGSLLAPVTFTAIVVAGPAASVAAASATAANGAPSTQSSLSPAIKVSDAFGNGVSGVSVAVSVSSGGTVSNPNPVTDATGVASAGIWTLGAALGAQTVTMTATGFAPIIFTVTVTAGFNIDVRFVGPTPPAGAQSAFLTAANRIQQAITGDIPNVNLTNFSASTFCGDATLPNMTEVVDDLVIFAEVVPIDGVGKILGQAGPCAVRPGAGGLPYVGIMQFDLADVNSMLASGAFSAVVLHEMHHVLGFGTVWTSFGTAPTLSGTAGLNPIFLGAAARVEYLAAGGTSANGVPVEAGGGAGTALSHWREMVFISELMTGFINGTIAPYSRMTIGSLADIGYTVAYTTADVYTVPAPGQLRANISVGDLMELREILIHPRPGLDPHGRPWTTPARDTVTITVRKPPRGQ